MEDRLTLIRCEMEKCMKSSKMVPILTIILILTGMIWLTVLVSSILTT